jgi:cobalamin biosynthesis Mg chelatase CobN
MKSLLSRSALVLVGSVVLLSSTLILDVHHAYAYTNYDQCVSGESVDFAPNGNLSDQDLTAIEAACRREFPARVSTSPRPSTRSAAPRANTSTSPAPSTSVSAAPSVSSSAQPATSQSSAPSSVSSVAPSSAPSSSAGSSSSSNSTSGDRSGPLTAPIFGNRADPNSIFRDPPQGANVDSGTAGQYAQPLIRLSDRQLAFQILVNFFLGIISVVCLLFLVFNGYRYAMARGEDNQISQAKKGITYAIIGLILVLAAYTIVATILNFGAQSASGIGISVGVQL